MMHHLCWGHVAGIAVLQESILTEVEERQTKECELLLDLISAAQTDEDCQEMAQLQTSVGVTAGCCIVAMPGMFHTAWN